MKPNRPVGQRRLLGVALLFIAVLALPISLAARGAEPDEEENEVRRMPGLVAQYANPGLEPFEGNPRRIDALPAFALSPGEAPDPRLNPRGWSVSWRGVIEILQPGRYRFSALGSGHPQLGIDGQNVELGNAERPGAELELSFGLHPLEILYLALDEPAENRLKLYWESEHFAREPLPAHALGHLPSDDPVVDLFARGRLMVEEHSCTACHRPGDERPQTQIEPLDQVPLAGGDLPLSASLVTRPGPKLSGAGSRLKVGWIYHWLGNPQQLRPEAVMPRLFSSDQQGDLERYAVAVYLASQGGPLAPAADVAPDDRRRLSTAGELAFQQIGCTVCHEPHDDRPARATLLALNAKTTPEALTAFLLDPAAIDPSGRMPGFDLTPAAARELAVYLTHRDAATAEPLELPASPPPDQIEAALESYGAPARDGALAPSIDVQLAELGRRVMQAKQCANCHEFKDGTDTDPWRPQLANSSFAAVASKASGGCLAPAEGAPIASVPVFGTALDREAVVAFLKGAESAPGTNSPGETARLALERFNCTGCHQRNGEGGLSNELLARLLSNQAEANAESVSPPPLTGIAGKLHAPALRRILEEGERHRPWNRLQMPRFGKSHVQHLPAGLAALDGDVLRAEPLELAPDAALAQAGRTLVGAKGFGCIKCHDMLGVASSGTRGADLAEIAQRINYDWYERWMSDPQRLQPGTRMPTVFIMGQSPYPDLLGGDPALQRLAIWQYLLASKELPPPESLEPAKVHELAADAWPTLLRTFMPGTTARAAAIRFANDVHLAYDLQTCRLAYAWTGGFLNLEPVWGGRGGNPAGLLGTVVWTSPAGFPWELTALHEAAPDFSGRGDDTSLGAALPDDGRLHPRRLHFRGYGTSGRSPTFRYKLDLVGGGTAVFRESVSSLRSDVANGIERSTVVSAPGHRVLWLNAALSEQPPQWQSPDGSQGILDQPGAVAPGDSVLRVIDAGQPLVLHLHERSPGAQWVAVKQQDQWALLVRAPTPDEMSEVRLRLVAWRPIDDRPETLAAITQAECQATTNGGM